jgi:hypothetical protein
MTGRLHSRNTTYKGRDLVDQIQYTLVCLNLCKHRIDLFRCIWSISPPVDLYLPLPLYNAWLHLPQELRNAVLHSLGGVYLHVWFYSLYHCFGKASLRVRRPTNRLANGERNLLNPVRGKRHLRPQRQTEGTIGSGSSLASIARKMTQAAWAFRGIRAALLKPRHLKEDAA